MEYEVSWSQTADIETMSLDSERLALTNHYTILIYPFLHRFKDGKKLSELEKMRDRWLPWWSRLSKEQIRRVVDDTYFFLPYIRAAIYPDVAQLKGDAGKDYANWVQQIEKAKLAAAAKTRLRRRLSPFGSKEEMTTVQRLTWQGDYGNRPWPLTVRAEGMTIGASLDWVDALLFPSGIGLLLLKVRLSESSPHLGRLIDLNYYLRLVQPPTPDWRMAQVTLGREDAQVAPERWEMRGWVDSWLRGLTDEYPYTSTDAGQIYGERFHLYSFACLAGVAADSPKGPFETPEDRILYEFATCTELEATVGDGAMRPSREKVAKMSSENRISVWQSWRGMSLKENVVFLGNTDLEFNRNSLAHNVESDYLPLYLYTLYQKYQLYRFSDQLIRRGRNVTHNRREMRQLMRDFIDFRNRYWFSEVTRKQMGSTLYRSFQRGLETNEIYALVSDEIRELQSYFEARAGLRNGALLNILTFVLLPLSTVAGIFELSFVGGNWKLFGWTCVGVGVGMFGLWLWLRRRL